MARSKEVVLKFSKILFYGYLLLFSLGPLLKVNVNTFSVNLIDLWIVPSIILILDKSIKKPKIFSYFLSFSIVCLFSLLFSFSFFSFSEIKIGFFYLVRLFSYFSFFVVTWNLTRDGDIKREKVLKLLILNSLAISVFGWVQYKLFPDLTNLKYLGWDDHYLRLVSTFLDPTFTGIILVFGSILLAGNYLKDKKYGDLIALTLIVFSVLLTYSRSSYLALISATAYLLTKNKKVIFKRNIIYLFLGMFICIVLFLPKNIGEGTSFLRTQSMKAKMASYKESLILTKKSPLVGMGFNNYCQARISYFDTDATSHGCSGGDSSLLFLLATTGILGLISFITLLKRIIESVRQDYLGLAFKSMLIALFVHSIFANSLFYPFVLGFMMIMLAISI